MNRGLFVVGTDTGVGKTVVACALLRGLRARGIDAGALKPVETGVDARGPLDAQALRRAAGGGDPLERVCPVALPLPAAPEAAARAAGRPIDPEDLVRAFEWLRVRHDCVIVEGAGGLRVPIAPGLDMAGLAAELELAVLVVARGALGTINHTLLTTEAVASRGLPLAGVVVSHGPTPLSAADEANLQALREALGRQLVGEAPPMTQIDALDASAAGILDPLLDRCRPTRP